MDFPERYPDLTRHPKEVAGNGHTDPQEEVTGEKEVPQKVKIVETPIFVPYTPDSQLRKTLQDKDDTIGEVTGSLAVRFIERCGGETIISLLGSSNPWAKDWMCGRLDCLQCKGRALLKGEMEEGLYQSQVLYLSLNLQRKTQGPLPNAPQKGWDTC